MNKDELIELCQKEFETYDVIYESDNRVIVDGKFRIIYRGNGFLDIAEYNKDGLEPKS